MKKIILPLLIILIFALVMFLPFLIKVKVSCRSQYGECSSDLDEALSAYNNKSMREAGSGIKKVLGQNPSISDFSTQFKLPDTITVNVIVKKPAFAVFDRDLGKTWLIEDNGKVLTETGQSPLPTVETRIKLERFQKVDDKTLFALRIMRGIYEMFQVQKGKIEGNSLIVEVPPRYTITFPVEGDVQVLLGQVRLVVSKLESDESLGNYSQIDLRFKNPVLR